MPLYTSRTKNRGYAVLPVRTTQGRIIQQPLRLGTLPGGLISGTDIFNSQPSTPLTTGARMSVAKTQMAISSTETLRLAASGPGVTPLRDGSDGLDGIVRALQAHLDTLSTGGWWTRANAAWAARGRDALAALSRNAAGHFSPEAVRAALAVIPSAVRTSLDNTIVAATLPTARVLAGYTSAQLLTDIAAGRYAAPSTTSSASGLLTSAAAASLRDIVGRSAGDTQAADAAKDLVDRLGAFSEGGAGGGYTDVMPTITPEQMDAIREQARLEEEARARAEAEGPPPPTEGLLAYAKPIAFVLALGLGIGLTRVLRSR